MKEFYKIFILDNVKSVRSRIELLLGTKDFHVIEASNSSEFFYVFSQNKCEGDLIIMDIELRDEDGFDVIKKIRNKNKNIPIIILTANNQRNIFVKGILEGVKDYILKPFEEVLIKDKIDKILNVCNNEDNNMILDLPSLLELEFRKSKKGKYSTSIMMISVYRPNNVHSEEIEREYLIATDMVYNNLKSIFWNTDIFAKYGPQSFIGVFPFADKDKVNIISDKVNECFNKLKQEKQILNEYLLSNVFLIYPEEVTEVNDVILKLTDRTKEIIK